MRLIFSVLVCFLVWSCNSPKSENTNENVSEEAADLFVPSDFTELTLEGTIDGKTPIIATIKNSNGRISGELIYKKDGKPIPLEGKVNMENMKLGELPEGRRGPIYDGTLTKETYNGTWKDVANGTELPFEMNVTKSDFADYSTMDMTGTYQIGEPNGETGYAMLAIEKISSSSEIKFFFSKVGNAPAYNQGTLTGKAALKANLATYSDVGEEWQCQFDMKFTSTQVKASSSPDADNCGFGNNIYVDGIYEKISGEKPDFKKLEADYGM